MLNKIIIYSTLLTVMGLIIIFISVNIPYYWKTKRFASQLGKCNNLLLRIGEFFMTMGIIGLLVGFLCWDAKK